MPTARSCSPEVVVLNILPSPTLPFAGSDGRLASTAQVLTADSGEALAAR